MFFNTFKKLLICWIKHYVITLINKISNNYEKTELLLRHHASLLKKDTSGKTAQDLAISKPNPEPKILDALKTHLEFKIKAIKSDLAGLPKSTNQNHTDTEIVTRSVAKKALLSHQQDHVSALLQHQDLRMAILCHVYPYLFVT